MTRIPATTTHAISDTGPLISAFQCKGLALLSEIFTQIHIPPVCVEELQRHGWQEQLAAASAQVITVELAVEEQARAASFAEQIARHPISQDRVVANHLGEAQAMALALRAEHRDHVLLVDERAARDVAKRAGLTISGLPGVLLLAVRRGLISAEEMRTHLETCRRQGTFYRTSFIEQVYNMAQKGRR